MGHLQTIEVGSLFRFVTHGSDFLTPIANATRILPKTESAAISSVTRPMRPVPTRPLRFIAIRAVVRTRRIRPVVRAENLGRKPIIMRFSCVIFNKAIQWTARFRGPRWLHLAMSAVLTLSFEKSITS